MSMLNELIEQIRPEYSAALYKGRYICLRMD